MKIYTLANSVWDADDYLNQRNTNPKFTDFYVFQSNEQAENFALNGLDYDDDIYNDGTIYEAELSDEEVLEITGFDSVDDFWQGIRGNLHEEEIGRMVADEDGWNGYPIDCANYNYDKTLEGAILVMWSWQTYVGYARKCEGIRYGYSDDTEALLTKQDKVNAGQVDVVMTAEEVEQAGDDLKEELSTRLHNGWKWTNPNHVDFLIEML